MKEILKYNGIPFDRVLVIPFENPLASYKTEDEYALLKKANKLYTQLESEKNNLSKSKSNSINKPAYKSYSSTMPRKINQTKSTTRTNFYSSSLKKPRVVNDYNKSTNNYRKHFKYFRWRDKNFI